MARTVELDFIWSIEMALSGGEDIRKVAKS